ncbi:MAG: glutamine-hydrolyzing GMP synthase [Candidatus Methanospirareceae archaeon]
MEKRGEDRDKVVVLDFGGQYSHLIVRRCRELGVYAELLPYDTPAEEIRKGIEKEEGRGKIKGIILSGSPFSVLDEDSPKCEPEILDMGIPVLGICYGAQLIAYMKGGKVRRGKIGEYGRTEFFFKDSILFEDINKDDGKINVWMSHKDVIERLSDTERDAEVIGYTKASPIAAYRIKNCYGVQFHPEVKHTDKGRELFRNFLYKICGCERNWELKSFIKDKIEEIREEVGGGRVICALSGGIDSSVTALLLHRAIGDRLTCIFVDHGLLRKGEVENVLKLFRKLGVDVKLVDAKKQFLEGLRGVKDAEGKRKVIGELFIKVFEEEAKRLSEELGNVEFLAQGTIYPDRIESARARSGKMASRIKSHHNVGALPEKLHLELIEPIKDLYKDEVREVAKELGVPPEIINRHPFPGPGLAARIIGEVTEEKLRICREASHIVEEELRKSGWYDKVWQAFAIVGDDVATGVLGDARSVGRIVTIRVVESEEAMTADFVKLPYDILEKISKRITNEIEGVTWVTYAISSKPPSTIEPC